jgi:ABC-2 type transport system permease protein
MTGKILGQAGVSCIMLLMYAGLGLATMTALAMMDLIPLIHLLYLAVFFVMAFFMIAAIMAGVGSAVSELRDAQSLITPAMLVLMVPLMLWFPITNNPNGALATISSFIPPLIPFVMILRVTAASEPVPIWQIIGTIVAGYAWMLIMIWMCAKVFRIGVLMYGKPPTPLELLRWLRYR